MTAPDGSNCVVLWGPRGCGKTTHAERIAQMYGMGTIRDCDDWESEPIRNLRGCLLITNEEPTDRHKQLCIRYGWIFVSFSRAMSMHQMETWRSLK